MKRNKHGSNRGTGRRKVQDEPEPTKEALSVPPELQEDYKDRISNCQFRVFNVCHQLSAIGFLLKCQETAPPEACPKIFGLGITLEALSRELHEVWEDLDVVHFSDPK